MQRCKSLGRGIRIRSGIQQNGGEFKIRVDHGHAKRVRTVRGRIVYVGSVLEQDLGGLGELEATSPQHPAGRLR